MVRSEGNMKSLMTPMLPKLVLPRLDEYTGPVPKGWWWQVKLNDERGWLLPDGSVKNRRLQPLAPSKAAAFADAIREVHDFYKGHTVDLALLGYRTGPWRPGAVVVLDVPSLPGPWSERYPAFSKDWPVYYPELGEPVPDLVNVLDIYMDALYLFRQTLRRPGLEGVVGRDPEATYQSGLSRAMAKSKWA